MAGLGQILKDNANLALTDSNKIKCSITGHEMPPNVEIVQQYLNSKRFQKAVKWYSHDFSQYLPHIVPHDSNPKLLTCKLTTLTLNRIPEEIEVHVNGKRFQRLKREFEEKEATRRAAKSKPQKEEEDDLDIWVPPEDEGEEEDGAEAECVDEDEEDSEIDGEEHDEAESKKIGKKKRTSRIFVEVDSDLEVSDVDGVDGVDEDDEVEEEEEVDSRAVGSKRGLQLKTERSQVKLSEKQKKSSSRDVQKKSKEVRNKGTDRGKANKSDVSGRIKGPSHGASREKGGSGSGGNKTHPTKKSKK